VDQGGPAAVTHYAHHRHHRSAGSGPFDWLGRAADALVLGLFLALLVVSPLPMGGNRDWAWSPMVVAAGAIAVLCALGLGVSRDRFEVGRLERRPMLALLGCFGFMVAIALVQMLPLAPETAAAIYFRHAREILGQASAPVAGLASDSALFTLLKCFACGLIFLMARSLCRDEAGARLLLMAFLVSAAIVMAYALYAQTATHGCYVGAFLKKQGSYSALNDRCLMSGTFVSSNNFACFVGMAVVAALALVLGDSNRRPADYEETEEDEDDDDGGYARGWLTGTRLALVALIVVCLGGLLISGSRAGFASTVVGAVALAWLMVRGHKRSRVVVRRAILSGVILALVVGLIAGGALLRKSSTLSNPDSLNRLTIWRVSLDAVRQSPLLGWGLGAYPDIYAIHQPETIPLPNDKAHSTPVETLVELGIPGGLAAFMVVLIPWWICLRGALRKRLRYLPAAAFAVSGVAIVHSLVDFSLQMPAIGFVVSAMLGMGWAHAFDEPDRDARAGR